LFGRWLFGFSVVLTSASAAWAQAPAAPTPPARVVAGQDGIAIESGNGDFRLQMGVLAQFDGRFALGDSNEQYVDTFAFRRLRPYLRGRFARRFEFYLNPDFAGGTLVVQDAYVDTVFAPALRIRVGKGKTPFGMERLHSASNLLFIDRALPTQLAPNRDLGVQVLGDLSGGVVSYLAGVMNGVADGGGGDLDTNDGKDVSGRLVVRPFNRRQASSPARGLGLAISASAGRAIGPTALPSFRTPNLQNPFFSYAAGLTGAAADGRRTRYSPQAWYFYKAFGGWGEYVHTTTPIRRGAAAGDIGHDAWQVAASWVLTGEAATDAAVGVRPRVDFGFGDGNWGAFQIAARYHALKIDDDALTLGLTTLSVSRKAESWTAGLNWYLSANFRYTVNFERTVFDDDPGGARKAENGFVVRTQVSF
jgi:phosphate-selective porin OprO/OprP